MTNDEQRAEFEKHHNVELLVRELHANCDSYMSEDCEEHDENPLYWCLKCRAASALQAATAAADKRADERVEAMKEQCAVYLDGRAAEAKKAMGEDISPGLRRGFDIAEGVLTEAAAAIRARGVTSDEQLDRELRDRLPKGTEFDPC